MARAFGKTVQICTFEPSPDIAEALRKTLGVNGRTQTTVIKAAGGAHTGDAPFTDNTNNSGKSGIGTVDTGGKTDKVTVKTLSLCDLGRQQTLPRLDLIKTDVKGSEADVLEGAETVRETFGPAMVMEAGVDPNHDRSKVKDILERYRYKMPGAIFPQGIMEATRDDYLRASGMFCQRVCEYTVDLGPR